MVTSDWRKVVVGVDGGCGMAEKEEGELCVWSETGDGPVEVAPGVSACVRLCARCAVSGVGPSGSGGPVGGRAGGVEGGRFGRSGGAKAGVATADGVEGGDVGVMKMNDFDHKVDDGDEVECAGDVLERDL